MRSLKLVLVGLLTVLSPLLSMAQPQNGLITANAGTRFHSVFLSPTVLKHTVDGLAQVSGLGNCRVHFDVVATIPPNPADPWKLEGEMEIVSADGSSSLKMEVNGWVVLQAGTPFGNLHYDAVVIGGTGSFEGARGRAEIDGAGMLTTPDGAEGTATWLLRGHVFSSPGR